MDKLFETRTEEQIRKDATAENFVLVHEALMGRGPWPLSDRQRKPSSSCSAWPSSATAATSSRASARNFCRKETM
ncbi:MAG: hypothetical protein P4K83_02260 [Terracidiphilus sp.]|nr:hypothetical protein [Terracidiphilus sp.]